MDPKGTPIRLSKDCSSFCQLHQATYFQRSACFYRVGSSASISRAISPCISPCTTVLQCTCISLLALQSFSLLVLHSAHVSLHVLQSFSILALHSFYLQLHYRTLHYTHSLYVSLHNEHHSFSLLCTALCCVALQVRNIQYLILQYLIPCNTLFCTYLTQSPVLPFCTAFYLLHHALACTASGLHCTVFALYLSFPWTGFYLLHCLVQAPCTVFALCLPLPCTAFSLA